MDNPTFSQDRDGVSFGPFFLSPAARRLTRDQKPVPVGARAFDILVALIERAGEVVSQRDLIARVWPNLMVEGANLRVHVAGLRRALEDGRQGIRYIVNVPGRGYSFVAPVARSGLPGEPLAGGLTAVGPAPKLPARLASMVGREDTVRMLSEQLRSHRLVSIVGPGGMGKTTVAVSVAHAMADEFRAPVFFVDLGTVTAAELVPAAVASALGIMLQGQELVLSLLAFIREGKKLLVLDNCEHVIDAAASLAERLIAEAPQLHLLATSREALRAEGEHVHPLYALHCPPEYAELTAAEALRYPAARLFMQRAVAAGLGSDLTDADAPSVARICHRLDGIALAIELAASCAGLHGIAETVHLLDNRFRLLWHGRRTALPRHKTLNALLDWSYNLLSEPEKLVLCRLSVFVGDFTLDAACGVAGDAVGTGGSSITGLVTNLVAKSLISARPEQGTTYYRLLDTTRTYAAARLEQRGETDQVALRHAATYARFLLNEKTLRSAFGEHEVSGFSRHTGNVRAALEWALSHEDGVAVGVELAASAAPLFIGLSLLDECRHWCERALTAVAEDSLGGRKEMVLQEALALSSMFTQGNSGKVRSAIFRGLELASALKDPLHELQLSAGLNIYLTRIGDFRGALATAGTGRQAALASGTTAGIVMAEWMLGVSHHLAGNQAAAQEHCEAGFRSAVQYGKLNADFFGYDHRIRALVALARALWLRGSFAESLKTAQQAIDEALVRNHPVSVCIALIYGSTVFFWNEDFAATEKALERLVAHAGRHSLAPYQAVGIGLKAQLAIARNQTDGSVDVLRTAVETLSAEQHNILLTVLAASLSEGLRKTGHLDEALLTIDGAIRRATECGAAYDMAELLRSKAEIVQRMSRGGQALAVECLKAAIGIAREQSALALELRATLSLARLLSRRGEQDEARLALIGVCRRFPVESKSTDLCNARRLIAELA